MSTQYPDPESEAAARAAQIAAVSIAVKATAGAPHRPDRARERGGRAKLNSLLPRL